MLEPENSVNFFPTAIIYQKHNTNQIIIQSVINIKIDYQSNGTTSRQLCAFTRANRS